MEKAKGRLVAVAAALVATMGCGDEPPAAPAAIAAQDRPLAIVSHIKVLSDKVEDVSSLEAWKRSFLHDGMTDEQKALAVWRSVVMFRHQDEPPREYLHSTTHVHDPIRMFNGYGYGQCCCSASAIEALAREAGLVARGRLITSHGIAEVFFDGGWHMFDGAFINYFPIGGTGPLASVDDIIAAVGEFAAAHPDEVSSLEKLDAARRDGSWRAGPPLLAACPFYDAQGLFPAGIHGWHSTMADYDGRNKGVVEYGYSQGYQVNIQLRPGERLTRNWSNHGLHVNLPDGLPLNILNQATGQGELRYTPQYGDLAPGRIGNGTLRYDVPLGDPALPSMVIEADNVVAGTAGPALHAQRTDRPGMFILRMPSSFVYLQGTLSLGATVGSRGSIEISVSDDNGLQWRPVARIGASGDRVIDLTPFVFRRYDYRLKFVLLGSGTGLDRLRLDHDVQHSQRALPALAQGDNTIRFAVGPQEGTITIEGATDPAAAGRNVVYTDFAPIVRGLGAAPLNVLDREGSITFPIETPGPMTRLRFGTSFRARDARDGWDYRISFDGGASWTTVARAAGPTPGDAKYVTFDAVPASTRSALVQFAGTQVNATLIFDFRIDADYAEPNGGFRPVRITYEWDEDGQSRSDVHVARTPNETYHINCAGKPKMKSITLELEG